MNDAALCFSSVIDIGAVFLIFNHVFCGELVGMGLWESAEVK
jgi:hypothetical protein